VNTENQQIFKSLSLSDDDNKSTVLFKYIELLPFKLHDTTVYVLTWKSTQQLLCYHGQLLYVETNTDPNADVLIDKERNIQLRTEGKNYQNPDVSSWTPDSSDYTYSEMNRKVIEDNEPEWIKTYGKGACVKVARGQLVSVSDTWDDWENCPALLTFVDHIGYKKHEITSGIKCYDALVFPPI
jgi:hypothetical protein